MRRKCLPVETSGVKKERSKRGAMSKHAIWWKRNCYVRKIDFDCSSDLSTQSSLRSCIISRLRAQLYRKWDEIISVHKALERWNKVDNFPHNLIYLKHFWSKWPHFPRGMKNMIDALLSPWWNVVQITRLFWQLVNHQWLDPDNVYYNVKLPFPD